MDDLRADFLRFVGQTSPDPIGIEIERAEGAWLYARDGRRYLDFISGIGVANLGHANPAVLAAIKRQAERYLHVMVYGEYVLDAQVKLARRLAQLLPRSSRSGVLHQQRRGGDRGRAQDRAQTHRPDRIRRVRGRLPRRHDGGAWRWPETPRSARRSSRLPGPVRHLPYGDTAALDAIDPRPPR